MPGNRHPCFSAYDCTTCWPAQGNRVRWWHAGPSMQHSLVVVRAASIHGWAAGQVVQLAFPYPGTVKAGPGRALLCTSAAAHREAQLSAGACANHHLLYERPKLLSAATDADSVRHLLHRALCCIHRLWGPSHRALAFNDGAAIGTRHPTHRLKLVPERCHEVLIALHGAAPAQHAWGVVSPEGQVFPVALPPCAVSARLVREKQVVLLPALHHKKREVWRRVRSTQVAARLHRLSSTNTDSCACNP